MTDSTQQPPKSVLRENIEAIFIAVLLALFIRTFIIQAFKIPSGSMLPTLEIGDHILVSKFIYGIKMPFTGSTLIPISDPKPNDVVVFQFPKNPELDYIKRVIATAGDIVEIELEPRAYALWHDRAVFHFLTTAERRLAYVRQVTRAVKPGGHVIVSTFGPEGPTKCSGLEVMRYDAASLHGEFGGHFRLVESLKELHQTPVGTTQQFLYCYCRLE